MKKPPYIQIKFPALSAKTNKALVKLINAAAAADLELNFGQIRFKKYYRYKISRVYESERYYTARGKSHMILCLEQNSKL